jgi:hypothetical protein
MTEFGWYDPDNQIKAAEISNALFANFKRGWLASSIYEIGDCRSDGFGLFVCGTGAPKEAATWIHNLTSILSDTTPIAYLTPLPGGYSIPSKPSTVHDLLLQKSNGHYFLVVWDEEPSPGATSACGCAGKTDSFMVDFGQSHQTVNKYDISAGTGIQYTYPTNTSTISDTVQDHAFVYEIIN